MKLREISHLFGKPSPTGALGNIEIKRVVTSSEEANENTLFYAKDGKRHLAKDTALQAISHGCRAVLTASSSVRAENTCLFQSDKAERMALILEKHLFFDILRDMEFVFVTGTKGKTTTTSMLSHILNKIGIPTATCGTLGFSYRELYHPLKNTTPDIFTLLPHFEQAKQQGMRYCVLEVSSQALEKRRIDGLRGKYAIFTGLSADHIDTVEHPNFNAYREAKHRLFSDFGVTSSFSPRDISLSPFMTHGVKREYYVDTKVPSDFTLKILNMSKSDILYSDGIQTDTLPLCGEYNLQNAALALLCASKITSMSPHLLYHTLRDFSILGRGERMTFCQREIWIDYAHNIESISTLSQTIRPFTEGKMIAVCGAVGDKARARRKSLSLALEKFFDLTILTEDDTVSESREEIIDELYSYFSDKSKAKTEPDRTRAISLALSLSKEGDTIVLLGKGHERFLLREGERILFDEREIVRDYFCQTTE